MYKLYLIYLMVLVGLASCAQSNYRFKQRYFFAQQMSFGRELRNPQGQPLTRKQDTLYFVYLETSGGEEPQFTAAFYKGKAFQTAVYPVNEDTVHVGSTIAGEEIVIRKNTGHQLLRLELTEARENEAKNPVSQNTLILNGHWHAQPFQLILKQPILLAANIKG